MEFDNNIRSKKVTVCDDVYRACDSDEDRLINRTILYISNATS